MNQPIVCNRVCALQMWWDKARNRLIGLKPFSSHVASAIAQFEFEIRTERKEKDKKSLISLKSCHRQIAPLLLQPPSPPRHLREDDTILSTT